jgi:DNA-binding NtrC family response regulator
MPDALCIVIADNRETSDGLHTYLNSRGIATRTSRRLRDAHALCANATALVLFPDDFADSDVLAGVNSLRSRHPQLLVMLVTGAAHRLRALCEPDTRSPVPIVLPKPAFGWSLLDAMRSHMQIEPT